MEDPKPYGKPPHIIIDKWGPGPTGLPAETHTCPGCPECVPDFKRPDRDPFDPGLPSFLAMAERRFDRYMATGDFPLSKPIEKGSVWRLREVRADGAAFEAWDGLLVIVSAAYEQDGKAWLHVSLSRKGRLPSYGDLCAVKQEFIGENREAVQVFAKKMKHVNLNPNVLHLWSRLDGSPLPDFSRGMGTI